MAVSVALSSNTPRIAFDDVMISYAEAASHARRWIAKPGNEGMITFGKRESLLTFRTDSRSPIVANATPPGVSTLTSPASLYYRTVLGTRYGFGLAVELQRYLSSQVPFDMAQDAAAGLGNWLARFFDKMFVWACMPGGQIMLTTTAATVQTSLTALTYFKVIANTANIGRSSVTANTALVSSTNGERAIDSRQVNILFAGQQNGVEIPSQANTWNSMDIAKNKCTVATFRRASVYNRERGNMPYPIKTMDRGTITGWLTFTTATNIMHLREDPEWGLWGRESAVIGPNQDIYEPIEVPVLYNHVLVPYDHIEEGLTGNTHLFGEGNADTPSFYKRASLILGKQAVTISEYDGDVKATPANEDEGGRSPKMIIDAILGMRANEKVTKDNLPKDHGITVLCHTDEVVG